MSLVSLDESVKNPSRCAASNTIPFRPFFHSTSAKLETTAFSSLKLFISFLWCRHLQVLFLVLLLFFSTRRKVSKNNKIWRKLFGKCQSALTFPECFQKETFEFLSPFQRKCEDGSSIMTLMLLLVCLQLRAGAAWFWYRRDTLMFRYIFQKIWQICPFSRTIIIPTAAPSNWYGLIQESGLLKENNTSKVSVNKF